MPRRNTNSGINIRDCYITIDGERFDGLRNITFNYEPYWFWSNPTDPNEYIPKKKDKGDENNESHPDF